MAKKEWEVPIQYNQPDYEPDLPAKDQWADESGQDLDDLDDFDDDLVDDDPDEPGADRDE